MPNSNSLARKRLFQRNPHCFWCGKLTVFSIDVKLKHDAATVDHLYSRLHPERKTVSTRQSARDSAHRGRGRLVLACNQCNKDRSNAETRGLMFVPKLGHRMVIAEVTTITPANAPAYKGAGSQLRQVVQNPPRGEEYGWIDNEGILRPRDWNEYCKYFQVELPEVVTHRTAVPRRQGLATIGELCGNALMPESV